MALQKKNKKLIGVLVLLLLCGGVGSAFFFFFKNFNLNSLLVQDFHPQMSYAELRKTLFLEKVAKVVPAEEITVASEINGQIKGITVQEGELVKGGQPLAFFTDTAQTYTLQVEQAKQQLDQALQAKEQSQLLYQEQLKLAEQGYEQSQRKFWAIQTELEQAIQASNSEQLALIQQKLLEAEQALKAGKLEYENLRNREYYLQADLDLLLINAKKSYEAALHEYANLTLRSPLTATVSKILLKAGDQVARGTPIFQLKMPKLVGEFLLTADEYLAIDEKAELPLYKGQGLFTGTIEEIQPFDTAKNQFKVRLSLPQEAFQEGEIFKLSLPFAQGQAIFPLEHIKLLSQEEWEIPYLSGEKLQHHKVKIQKLIWPFVQLDSQMPSDFSLLLLPFTEENQKLLDQLKMQKADCSWHSSSDC